MKREAYVPERGDAIWITLTPQVGHEQAGRRPALVLSPASYNGKVGLAVLCPITSQIKGYPFEVAIPEGLRVRSRDIRSRWLSLKVCVSVVPYWLTRSRAWTGGAERLN